MKGVEKLEAVVKELQEMNNEDATIAIGVFNVASYALYIAVAIAHAYLMDKGQISKGN